MSKRMTPESTLQRFYSERLITNVLNAVKSGKEATVYRCQAHPATGKEFLVAKIYRPLHHRSFRNDSIYQQGRMTLLDDRSRRAFKKKTRHGRSVQFSKWVESEFETLNVLHHAGADVPRPFAQSGSAILMEYIGDEQSSAPMLNRVRLRPAEAQPLFRQLMRNVRLMLASNRVHADLSPFNILYWQGRLKIIDFPQSVHARRNPNAFSLLSRDIENLYRYFSRYGVQGDPFQLTKKLWMGFLERGCD